MSFQSQNDGWWRSAPGSSGWLGNNHVLYNPAADIELPRTEHRLPKCVLTASEAEQVINQAEHHAAAWASGTGPSWRRSTRRASGAWRWSSLRPYDIDVERGTVVVRQGKGKKDRMIPIGDRALAWIERYLVEVRPGLLVGDKAGDVLFLTQRGQPVPAASDVETRAATTSTPPTSASEAACHLFRHTMATVMLENGADIRYIQAMLGHAKLETTQIYTQVSIRKLKEVHTATHPARNERST